MKQKQALMIGGGILILGVGFFIYKKIKAKKNMQKYGMGDDIGLNNTPYNNNNNNSSNSSNSSNSNSSNSSSNFNPRSAASSLKDALGGWGTDEDKFFDTANNLNDEQKKEVVNYFNTNYGDLKDWIEGDFSGSDEKRALRVMGL
jgi:hypothetical protein|tara:strand:+ start:182 stop:616 length:435 start_codon:yes stop_codon:yes gene_type:complete